MTDKASPRLVEPDTGIELALACAQHLICRHLVGLEKNEERIEKMERILGYQREAIATVGVEAAAGEETVRQWLAEASRDERIGFLVEVSFLDPFSPYQIDTKKKQRNAALVHLDETLAPEPSFAEIGEVAEDAAKSHNKVNWKRAGVIGVGTAALLAAGGFAAAPFIGAALGTAAGLGGAAATAHGLALLGGGALAAGGVGVAGGMWMVAGVMGAAGAVMGGGGMALYQLGSASATRELIKLQATFKLAVLSGQVNTIKAQKVIEGLNDELAETQKVLAEALLVNEKNSRRVKDLDETITALEEAITWMENEVDEAA